MQWFRHYHGLCTDPKLHKISRRLKVPRYLIVAAWCAVLEFASDKPDGERGSIDGLDATEFAFMVGCSENVAGKVLAAFFDVGMLTENRVFNFAKRNFKSDRYDWERIRQAIIERDSGVCAYCGVIHPRPDVDHIIPRSRGGTNAFDNLTTACPSCNRSKGAKTPDEWLS